ncbi:MAG: hypothetical protein A2252_06915 [Elusimicrobia bacterium RIFOXYA2_FULL_39_19]|nr:MAG: hypothetical protein A2252_06915 [Elusimicrobia bacterium RIFOXYA2_FULL_39_19]
MDLLKYKSDFKEAKQYWNAFWNKEVIDRPCISITAPLDEKSKKLRPYQRARCSDTEFDKVLIDFDVWAESTYFGADAVPFFRFSFGPDQFSSFLGAELTVAEDKQTSWVNPYVTDWKTVKLQLNEDNENWKKMLYYINKASKFGEGKFITGMIDLHSNMDCLSAVRDPANLCMDILDCPEELDKVMKQVRSQYVPIHKAIHEAGAMVDRGCIGWIPCYAEGKFAVVQCDFMCMISPEHARRFVMPAVAEEAAYLDYSIFHLDGANALVHLDDILAIPDIDAVQWVPGAGKPPLIEWMDILKKIIKAKKGTQLYCTVEEAKIFHKELGPQGVFYDIGATSKKEADDLIAWFKKNT